ncbi:MAG: chemotaxis protein CheW [Ignavibacteriota bacterium]
MSVAQSTQYATFVVEDLLFGIDVLRVQEVLRYQAMTRIPLAPTVAEGLINLRGQIVTALDMRRRLGLMPRSVDRLPMNLVVRTEEGPVSLLVDEIGDVLQLEPADFEAAPDNLTPAARELVTGVYKLKDRLLLVLDPDQALEVNEFMEPRPAGTN